jgi:hypothetical protein
MRVGILAVLVLAVPGSARAQTTVTAHGGMTGPVPIGTGFAMDEQIHLYEETMGIELAEDLVVDVGPGIATYDETSGRPSPHRIPADSIVSCYLVHFNPTEITAESGTLRVEEGVLLGFAFGDATLTATDALCAPGIAFPEPAAGSRGLGFGGSGDRVVVRSLNVDFTLAVTTGGHMDQVRVFVGSPPSSGDAGPVGVDAGALPAIDAGGPTLRDAGVIAVNEWDYRGSGGCTCAALGTGARARSALAAHGLVAVVVGLVLVRRRRRV